MVGGLFLIQVKHCFLFQSIDFNFHVLFANSFVHLKCCCSFLSEMLIRDTDACFFLSELIYMSCFGNVAVECCSLLSLLSKPYQT